MLELWLETCAGWKNDSTERQLYPFAKAAVMRHHRLSGLKTEIYFLIVLEAGRSRSMCQQG